MLTRRGILAGGAVLATTGLAHAAGKKAAGAGEDMGRVIGIDGRYTSFGRNPDGSDYTGRTEVTQQGEAVEFTWQIGDGTTRGSGVIEGRVVTVDWGDSSPVVYVVMDDGELHGTWADGKALEKLTP